MVVLYNVFNLAILQSLGKSPGEMEILHISAIGLNHLLEISLKFEIPVAFEMSIHLTISKTFFSVIKVRLK